MVRKILTILLPFILLMACEKSKIDPTQLSRHEMLFLGPMHIADVIFKDNNIWMATKGDGVHFYNGSTWKVFTDDNSNIESNRINGIDIFDDIVYVATNGDGLSYYNGNEWQNYNKYNSGLYADYTDAVVCDKKGIVYIGGFNYVSILDGQNWISYTYSENDSTIPRFGEIKCMKFDENGKLWVSGDYMSSFDGTNWKQFKGGGFFRFIF